LSVPEVGWRHTIFCVLFCVISNWFLQWLWEQFVVPTWPFARKAQNKNWKRRFVDPYSRALNVYNNVAVTQEQDMQHPKHTATRKVRKQGRKSIKYRNIKQSSQEHKPRGPRSFFGQYQQTEKRTRNWVVSYETNFRNHS
jgi:hypothetical protein